MEIEEIIILVTMFFIYGIFLIFDLFGRNEKYGYLAYIAAVLPVNYYWVISEFALISYLMLFILWDITLLRDTIGIHLKKEKEINDIVLYLVLGILVQLIVSAIIPEVNEDLQGNGTEAVLNLFWLPNVHSEALVNEFPLGFQVAATLLVLLVIIPLILDIKDEEIPFPMFIVIIALFIIPFLYLSYIWIPAAMGVLTFLFSVILFVVLLLITKSEK